VHILVESLKDRFSAFYEGKLIRKILKVLEECP